MPSLGDSAFIFFLALLLFGPKKLPELARQLGKLMAEFRRASNEFKSQIEQEIAHLEVEGNRQTILPPSPSPEGTTSRTLNAASSEATPADAAATADAPASLASSEELPSAQPIESATEAVSAESVTSSNSQESHV